MVVAAASAGLGALLGLQIRQADDAARALAHVLDRGALTFGLPLIALLLAADGFAVEVNRRTLVYHLVRPVSRTTLFVARFLAGFLPATLAGFVFLFAIAAASGVRLPAATMARSSNFIISNLSPVEDTTALAATLVLVIAAAVVLGVGAWIVSHRDFKLRE